MESFFYLAGDGQEAMPGNPLPQLLQVGVARGQWPSAGASVEFVAEGNGRVAATREALPTSFTGGLLTTTDANGVATCAWRRLIFVAIPPKKSTTAVSTVRNM